MKIDRITYQKIFPTGMMYLNHKIGVEVQLDPGDDELTAFNFAKSFVEEMNLNSNPGMAAAIEYMVDGHHVGPVVKKEPKDSAQRIIDQINQCSDKTVLESFKLLAKTNPEIQKAYDYKLINFK